jgi:hypothetical protein
LLTLHSQTRLPRGPRVSDGSHNCRDSYERYRTDGQHSCQADEFEFQAFHCHELLLQTSRTKSTSGTTAVTTWKQWLAAVFLNWKVQSVKPSGSSESKSMRHNCECSNTVPSPSGSPSGFNRLSLFQAASLDRGRPRQLTSSRVRDPSDLSTAVRRNHRSPIDRYRTGFRQERS